MQVFCYMNLHRSTPGRPVYSIRDVATGRVVDWRTEVYLEDVTFKVSEAGRQRVLREKKKNVHGGVQGTLIESPTDRKLENKATYNPYKYSSFVDRETETPIYSANYAKLSAQGVEYTH